MSVHNSKAWNEHLSYKGGLSIQRREGVRARVSFCSDGKGNTTSERLEGQVLKSRGGGIHMVVGRCIDRHSYK